MYDVLFVYDDDDDDDDDGDDDDGDDDLSILFDDMKGVQVVVGDTVGVEKRGCVIRGVCTTSHTYTRIQNQPILTP